MASTAECATPGFLGKGHLVFSDREPGVMGVHKDLLNLLSGGSVLCVSGGKLEVYNEGK